jgi:hypothetical protein
MSKLEKNHFRLDNVQLPDTYRNVLSSGFTVVENMLSDISSVLKESARDIHGTNLLQVQKVQNNVLKMYNAINHIRKELNLERDNKELGSIILSRVSKIWEVLCDLKTERLKGYGSTPTGLSSYLNPRIDELLNILDQILEDTKTLSRERVIQPKQKNNPQ